MARGIAEAYIDNLTLNRIAVKLNPNNLFGREIRAAMKDAAEFGQQRAKQRAPYKNGHLESSIYVKLDSSLIPTWAKISTEAATTRGKSGKEFRYGWALQASKKIKYHYRKVKPGRLTRNWFKGTIPAVRKRLNENLAKVAGRIERKWAA